MTTRLLAFDTATDAVHLAVAVDGRVLARAEPGGAAASAGLLAALQRLLAEAGLALRDLDAIGFGRGPGAFTGLRTACAVAQGLALGVDRPLLALDTLAAVAECARRQGATAPLWAATDARMGEIYAQRWAAGAVPGAWQGDTSVALYTPAALAQAVAAVPAGLAGNALKAHAEALQPAAMAGGTWPDAVPDGEALAALAQAAWARGDTLDAAAALPLYVRDKVAQTSAERHLARVAAR